MLVSILVASSFLIGTATGGFTVLRSWAKHDQANQPEPEQEDNDAVFVKFGIYGEEQDT